MNSAFPAPSPDRARALVLPAVRGLAVAVPAFAGGVPLLVLFLLSVALVPLGAGVLLVPPVAAALRALVNGERRLAGAWFGVPVAVPYAPVDAPRGVAGVWRRCRAVLTEPATWRDLLWTALAPVTLLLGVVPAALLAHGLEGVVVLSWLTPFVPGYPYVLGWLAHGPAWLMSPLAVVEGVALIALGVRVGPALLAARARLARLLLAPTGAALLAARVRDLSESRSEVVTAEAAELRRIERDLHDGPQARIVALGMSLGMAEDLMADDPALARRLLAEARAASDTVLAELRDLVRGIHPPVLAERGLGDALGALALALPLPVETRVDLPGRPAAPVETAAYFVGAEALANVVKHSGAGRAWVSVRYAGGLLRLEVGDDGRGGAVAAGGTGLRGMERRARAHDGTLSVTSPPGGPTVVTLEVPCALSSPRTMHS